MRVLVAVGKGLFAYGFSLVYLAHLIAASTALDVAKQALDEKR
jgi:hypothetical protein